MLNITRSGQSLGEAAASLRDIPAWVIPYATAAALTRTAKIGQSEMISAMRSAFDRPTAYTLNSTFITVATKDSLTARIGIKNQLGRGVVPENFLFPEVFGGGRREKRFERALRFAGFLRDGERAMPGAGVPLDGYGNVSASTIRNILRQVGSSKKSTIFAGALGRKQTRGIWKRDGRSIKPLFVFTTSMPQYSQRLDFAATAETATRQNFSTEFYRAVNTMLAKARP